MVAWETHRPTSWQPATPLFSSHWKPTTYPKSPIFRAFGHWELWSFIPNQNTKINMRERKTYQDSHSLCCSCQTTFTRCLEGNWMELASLDWPVPCSLSQRYHASSLLIWFSAWQSFLDWSVSPDFCTSPSFPCCPLSQVLYCTVPQQESRREIGRGMPPSYPLMVW